jgi:hypothetical protein
MNKQQKAINLQIYNICFVWLIYTIKQQITKGKYNEQTTKRNNKKNKQSLF